MKKLLLSLTVIAAVVITAMSFRSNNGEYKSEFRNVDTFKGINLKLPADVYLKQGAEQSVKIEAEEKVLSLITTEIKKGSLIIDHERTLKNFNNVKIYITVSNLESVSINGSGNVISETLFKGSNLDLSIAGSGDVKMALDYSKLSLSIAGSGNIQLSGRASIQDISIAGSGDIKSIDLISEKAKVSIAGSGSCTLDTKDLDASIAGSGDIFYKSTPANISTSISGSGTVKAAKS